MLLSCSNGRLSLAIFLDSGFRCMPKQGKIECSKIRNPIVAMRVNTGSIAGLKAWLMGSGEVGNAYERSRNQLTLRPVLTL
jgi:hypothetical protein